MARTGGFGGGFQTGSLGSLGQYDIAADLADLEVYQIEVAWGNGLANDDEYLAALRKVITATDPETRKREAAQNKLDDAVYRIGRSKAEEKGLDQLIAFDQAALATMKTDNLRYRDVKDSLDAELAQRRSRDYGKLVDAFNDGDTSTKSLRAWVTATLGGLTKDDPDFDSWTGVAADLTERISDEADAKVYQDYQQNRLTGDKFVAHIKARRDAYDPESPKYADWNRKLEDAQDNVRDKALAAKDSAFFNRYEEGKVSDNTYLKYLRNRISGMESGDPQKGEWQHRLNQAAFSIAEDKLRFSVERGKAPVSRLVSFYKSYRSKLNPGSSEWRQISRAIDSLAGRSFGGGGGGSGRGGGSSKGGGGSTGSGGASSALPTKQISSKYTLSNTLNLFSIDPTASKKSIAEAKKFLDYNKQSIGNAVRAGDAVWLFQDPRKPGSVVPGQHPDGSPMLDAKGKPVMVRGSVYLPASGEAYANILSVEASNWQGMAEFNLAKGKHGDYVYGLKRAAEVLDQARAADGQAREQNWQEWYDATSKAVDGLTRQGQYGEAVALATELAKRLAAETDNPYLDDTRRDKLETIGKKLANNPLVPRVDPVTGNLVEGAISVADLQRGTVTLNPGWHHVLKSSDAGMPDYGPVYDERQDGTWEQEHVTVHTTYGGRVVTGEVKRSEAPTAAKMVVSTPEGRAMIDAPSTAEFISFQDEDGQAVRAYSLDGVNWIKPAAGMPAPTIELTVPVTNRKTSDGGEEYITANGDVVLTRDADGAWQPGDYTRANPGVADWYGAAAYRASAAQANRMVYDTDDPYDAMGGSYSRKMAYLRSMDVGGEGQHMTYATTSDSGVINLAPSRFQYGTDKADGRGALERGIDRKDARDQFYAKELEGEPRRFLADEAYRAVSRQLPRDTPARYEGYDNSGGPRAVDPRTVARVLPPVRKALPALTPVKLATPRALDRAEPDLSLKPVKTIGPGKPRAAKTPVKPPVKAPAKKRRAAPRKPKPRVPPSPSSSKTPAFRGSTDRERL